MKDKPTGQTLYHGTGARRMQSLGRHGLRPGPGTRYVYASPDVKTAGIFAAIHAFEEEQLGLIVSFPKRGCWRRDVMFPDSVRHRGRVEPRDLSFSVLRPEEEFGRLDELYELAKKIGVRLEREGKEGAQGWVRTPA